MNEEEIYEMILNEDVEKYPLLNEIFAIRDNRHKVNNYTICVNGYISLAVINKAIKLQKENKELKEKNKKMCNEYCPLVQKIKDKIEELEKEKKKMGNGVVEIYEKDLIDVDIEFLQKLIQEREEK